MKTLEHPLATQLKTSISLCFVIALAVHLLLAAFMTFHFCYTQKTSVVNEKSTPSMHSYLYTAPIKTLASKKTLVQAPVLPSAKEGLTLAATSAVAHEPAATPAKATDVVNPDALSQLLHQAIQAEQRYPDSAIALQRSGIVTVAFVLNPDGSISELQCVNSSGTVSLDNAALDAVRAASPFQGISGYLTSSKSFQLSLRFELPG